MCYRKIFLHHQCAHYITFLVENCVTDNVECQTVKDKTVMSNKYPCIVQSCPFYGRFD
ncbi:hypothetical protein N658DRAFT_436904 [Parathielavia hyrcaniae]|uniref:Uncharacterized protein n=1 Tax=Parathielavia hyrcaniae TaxID=113614 RepID=A0AAN6SWY0_9PEZI|nr:hypothetical protein N658DRAFT_436904 [Parathielavia hyrcaniae]